MGLYKFCKPEHAQAMVDDGTIRISRADYFRRMEDEMLIPGIGDRVDSINSLTSFSVSFRRDTPLEQLTLDQRLARQIALMITGGLHEEVTFNNTNLSFKTNNYIWCFSSASDETGLFDFNSTVPIKFHYDAAVRISSIESLLYMLKLATIENLGDIPLLKYFERFKINNCTYDGNQLKIENSKYVFSNWAKLPAFAPQQEVRVVFFPPRNEGPEHLIVKIPMPRLVFSSVDLRSR